MDREGGEPFFFCLWKMEAGFMTHVPCPPVKITQQFSRVAASSAAPPMKTRVCGEETKQTGRKREKRRVGRKYLQPDLRCVHHQREGLFAPPGETRLFRGNRDWQSPRARWGLFVCSRRQTNPTEMQQRMDLPHVGG